MSKQLTPIAYDKIVRGLFDSRVSLAHKIAAGCVRYLGTIADFIRGSDPAEYTRINTAIEQIYGISWKPFDVSGESPIGCVGHWADVFDQLNALDNNIAAAITVLTTAEYLRKAIQQTSTTAVNIYQERSYILAMYDTYRTTHQYDDVAKQIDKVGIYADTLRQFAVSRDKFNQITAHIMKEVISSTADSATIWKLQSRIEELKNNVLGSTRSADTPLSLAHYGLVPVSRPMKVDALASFLGIDPATTPDDLDKSLEKATGTSSHGAIMIYLGLFNAAQLEFNLSGLIDNDYVVANDLKTITGSGLTKKVIQRLSTINRLPRDLPGTVPISKLYGGSERSQYWIIQQIITGPDALYRMMGFGYLAAEPTPVYAPMITGLLRGCTSRPEDYNEIHTDAILSGIYDSEIKTILSAYTVAKLQSPSSDLIRSKILDSIVDNFIDDHKKRPMTMKTVRTRAVDAPFIVELLITILMPNPTKNYTERVLTAVAKVDTVTNVFMNELEKRWMNAIIPDRLFREYTGANLIEQLRGICINTVTAAINELERAGTWASLEPSLKEFYFEYKSDRS